MSKRTNAIASKVMKLAHSIKSQFSSFSAALKAAWAQFKVKVEMLFIKEPETYCYDPLSSSYEKDDYKSFASKAKEIVDGWLNEKWISEEVIVKGIVKHVLVSKRDITVDGIEIASKMSNKIYIQDTLSSNPVSYAIFHNLITRFQVKI